MSPNAQIHGTRHTVHHRTRRPAVWLLTVALVCPTLGACDSQNQANDNQAGQSQATGWHPSWDKPESKFADYRFIWDQSGVERSNDGTWWTQTDLGYVIQVNQGWIVNYSTSLVPCLTARWPEPSPFNLLAIAYSLLTFVVPTAHAGHGEVADPSSIADGMVEAIGGEMRRIRIGPIPTATYCDIHYLVARGDAATTPHPDAPDMAGRSLLIEGTFQAPGDDQEYPIAVDTDIAYGTLRSAHPDETPVTERQPITVNQDTGAGVLLVRPMSRLFDGIDFKALEPSEVSRAVLKNLLLKTRFFVYP